MSIRGTPLPSSLEWCKREMGPIARGVQLLVRSQLGYDGRQMEKKVSRKVLQTVVMGGDVVDPVNKRAESESLLFGLPPLPSIPRLDHLPAGDALARAAAVAYGIRTFAGLLAQGTCPGSGGYTLNDKGEKVYGGQGAQALQGLGDNVVQGFTKLTDLIGTGAISLPGSLMQAGAVHAAHRGQAAHKPFLNTELAAVEADAQTDTTGVRDETGLTAEEAAFLIKAARSVDDMDAEKHIMTKADPSVYRPAIPSDFRVELEEKKDALSESRERAVPATRIGRLATFGQLAVGLGAGAAAELTRRVFRFGGNEGSVDRVVGDQNPFLTPANADRIVQTLCRVRGAALKMGQMLSIQDEESVNPALLEIFERVRHSADFMPQSQVSKQMAESFGPTWREKFGDFEMRPFAAASIGQVHKATLPDGRVVAVKVQYPGVAEGIDSDIANLVSVLSVGGFPIFPKGMYLDNFVKVARRELRLECDYEREARAYRKFGQLLADSKDFYVPEVVDSLSSSIVLTTEYVAGKPVDKCVDEPQVVRDYISAKFIELCLKEIFEWRFMQTDPNWSNFFLGKHPKTGEPRLVLLDFGASRAYGKEFVDKYMRIIKGAYDGDEETMLKYSREIGFLTGYETKVMEQAHCESIKILGETLTSSTPYDFSHQNVTRRIHELIPVMLEHRLTSPPEEIYSLHRKLSGSYLLATRLNATVSCGHLFTEINKKYTFGEDGKDIDIDEEKKKEGKRETAV